MTTRVECRYRDRHGLAVSGQTALVLNRGWEFVRAEPGCHGDLTTARNGWQPALVPGTVAAALVAAGYDADAIGDLDAWDWWYRCRFELPRGGPDESTFLRLDGLATVAEVWLNGEPLLMSDSMFRRYSLPVDGLAVGENELVLGFRALAPLLVDRKPRPRWRTRIVPHQALRRYRTTIFGRAPGFAPGPTAVGPWRLVALERSATTVECAALRPSLDGTSGRLDVHIELRAPGFEQGVAEVTVRGPSGDAATDLRVAETADGRLVLNGVLHVPDVDAWWPHTHGQAALYEVAVTLEGPHGALAIDAGKLGFRKIDTDPFDRFQLRVNGCPVFCRGGSLMPDRVLLDHREPELREILTHVCAAGMNMVRLSGVTTYGDDLLYQLCDELGLLVWQDFAFANMDYPGDDPDFRANVTAEVVDFLGPAGRHPSLAVLCGGSEIEQQATMMGVDPSLAPGALFDTTIPSLVTEAAIDIPYIRSSPTGGPLPIKPRSGISHYYGVGAYLRPLTDARRANVHFAAECLAFSNVPEETTLPRVPSGGTALPHDAVWKRGVPRDVGTTWDFEDVRDHYLRELYAVDPVAVRTHDSERYLELSRVVTGVIMAETLGEWRRAESSCSGALVWWLNDILPGGGFGLIDAERRPKPAYWIARRPLQPVAVWLTDEGTNGVAIHIANDTTATIDALLDVRLLRDSQHVVIQAECVLTLEPHSTAEHDVEAVLGCFVDPGYAYRFGSPQHDVVAVTLLSEGHVLSQAVLRPHGLRSTTERIERFAVTARVLSVPERSLQLETARVTEYLRVVAPGFRVEDDWFVLVPGFPRIVSMHPIDPDQAPAWPSGRIEAYNGGGSIAIPAVEHRA